ncbi:MAG: integral rane protein, partial [Microbacteriaceae bacterium]|nr:integral rane protein [Microbacteriaceae bacterium]
VVFGSIGAVVQSATVARLYIDLRMRKEGLDLERARFVEARQAGATDLPDPYAQTIDRENSAGGTQTIPSNDSPWT